MPEPPDIQVHYRNLLILLCQELVGLNKQKVAARTAGKGVTAALLVAHTRNLTRIIGKNHKVMVQLFGTKVPEKVATFQLSALSLTGGTKEDNA